MNHHLDNGSDDTLDWLAQIGYPALRVEPLSGDVSARRYRRVFLESGPTAILALYPEDLRAVCQRFLETSRLLLAANVPVPGILAADCGMGRMLLEDGGAGTLYDTGRSGDWATLGPYFRRALELADSIAGIDPEAVAALNPPLDSGLLRRELDQTLRMLLGPRGLAGPERTSRRLEKALDELCDRLGKAPPVVCHRDFMARNLIPSGPSPGLLVIDHQDLRLGPRFYDAASLLNDSLFPSRELERIWLADRLLADADRLDYGRTVVQRALKAAGTFEAFAQRGQPRYRPLIRPTLARAAAHLAELPETTTLAPRLVPLWLGIDLLD